MKLNKLLCTLAAPVLLGASLFGLTSCGETEAPAEKEIALGTDVGGNWSVRGLEKGIRASVFVDAETKFHFTVEKLYAEFGPSSFAFEGQITTVSNKNVATCFAVIFNSYLNHQKVDEAATAAAKTQFAAYKTTIPDIYNGESSFEFTFHRLSSDVYDNGYITFDNADFDITLGIFDAVEKLAA